LGKQSERVKRAWWCTPPTMDHTAAVWANAVRAPCHAAGRSFQRLRNQRWNTGGNFFSISDIHVLGVAFSRSCNSCKLGPPDSAGHVTWCHLNSVSEDEEGEEEEDEEEEAEEADEEKEEEEEGEKEEEEEEEEKEQKEEKEEEEEEEEKGGPD